MHKKYLTSKIIILKNSLIKSFFPVWIYHLYLFTIPDKYILHKYSFVKIRCSLFKVTIINTSSDIAIF